MIVQHRKLRNSTGCSALLLHFTDKEKECTPHCVSPPYGQGEKVYPTSPLQFFPTLWMRRKSEPLTVFLHLTDGESVVPSLFKVGKNSGGTLFIPFITVGM